MQGHRVWVPGTRAVAGTMHTLLLIPPKQMRPIAHRGTLAQGAQWLGRTCWFQQRPAWGSGALLPGQWGWRSFILGHRCGRGNPQGPNEESGLWLDILLCWFSCTKGTRALEQDAKEQKVIILHFRVVLHKLWPCLILASPEKGNTGTLRAHLVHTAVEDACNRGSRTAGHKTALLPRGRPRLPWV